VGRVVVVRGKAERTEYVLDRAGANIGRLPELTDAEPLGDAAERYCVRRRLEGGEYRLCDDGSEFGTRVLRDGRPIWGRAWLRFER
jgi:hypothetical protein